MAETIVLLERMRNYLHMASLALCVFEHFITANLEITYIWKSRWNLIKVLYIFARYSTYVDVILNIIRFIMIGVEASDLILNLRVWAVWRKTMAMSITLVTLNIGFITIVWVNGGLLLTTLKYIRLVDLQDILHEPGCIATEGRVELALVAWIVLLAYQAGQSYTFELLHCNAWVLTWKLFSDVDVDVTTCFYCL
ncbi:hypothetical protein BDQ17DRAFT_1328139 [Cyathus striatus]|nr:hypothetical protein BDQ17DRAFT_1328139 [Cyathus striatus]